MTQADFWTHIKDSAPMAILGSLLNFFYTVLPIKKFKNLEHFILISLTRLASLLLCLFFGLFASFICKLLGYANYADVASALGALGGRKILDAIYKVALKYVESYEKKEA